MSTKTADGLRDRLFDTLDALLDKKISTKEVESVCYVSEQIIKTARVELEIAQEHNRASELKRQHELTMKREEKEVIKLLESTIEASVVEE
jgi:hypothetical protein